MIKLYFCSDNHAQFFKPYCKVSITRPEQVLFFHFSKDSIDTFKSPNKIFKIDFVT